jgi:hypothetical protein
MKLKEVQWDKEEIVFVAARIPKKYKELLKKLKIHLPTLICKAIDEVQNDK